MVTILAVYSFIDRLWKSDFRQEKKPAVLKTEFEDKCQ